VNGQKWRSDAPTEQARARHRAWVRLNYPCTYAEYLRAKRPVGSIQATPQNGKPPGWKSDAPTYADVARHREWCRINRRWVSYADYMILRRPTIAKMHATIRDRGLRGSVEAIVYKINAKARGIY